MNIDATMKISIITITYNAEHCLQRTLDSVRIQSYSSIEHVIIDGASKDRTLSMAENYRRLCEECKSEHEVRIFSEPDKGIYDAMNKGIGHATGDYLVFLNAGDFLPSESTISDIVDKTGINADGMDKNTLPGVIYGETDIVDEKGKFLQHRRLRAPERLTSRSFLHGMLVCHQAFYVRTDIARSVPYDLRYRLSADVDWCIRVMREAEKKGLQLANTHTIIANYTKEGESTRHHRASLKERFMVMRRNYGLLPTVAMHAWFVVRAVIKR